MLEVPLEAVEENDPWMVPLVDRIRMFRSENTRIAYYYRQPDSSTFRYRSFNMAQAINDEVPGVSASWFWERDGNALETIVKDADVLVVCRVPYSTQLAHLMSLAKRFGTRVIFDVDDYVFDISTVAEVVTVLDQFESDWGAGEHTWNWWFASFARMRAAMELADEIIVTNEYLAARTRTQFDVPVHIVPNFMGTEQLEYSAEVVAARVAAGNTRNGLLHVGYFSGTPTHNRDFAIVAGALARQLERRDDLRVRLVGYLDLHDSPLHAWSDRIDFIPITNYLNLQRLIGETEINIAPLQDTPFTNCKSELKYFDAAAVGIPTMASPTFTMSAAITHGTNGLLVRVDEWDEQLTEFLDNYETTGPAMGNRALEHAVEAYRPKAMVASIVAALGVGSTVTAR